MNSLFANLFLALQARVAAVKDTDNKPYFAFIDQDYGQLEYHTGDMRVPVSWPCCLIDISSAAFQNEGQNVQDGVVSITFRLGFPPYSGTSNLTDPVYRQKALYYYDLEALLHKSLHGWVPQLLDETDTDLLIDAFGHLMRTTTITEDRTDHIRVRAITYTLSMQDYTTSPTYTLTTITPAITLSIDNGA